MTPRNWRGTTLFLSILAVLGATLGLKFYSVTEPPAATTSLSTGNAGASVTAPPSGAETIKGDAVGTPYGNVQVQVLFSGTTITKIEVLQVPRESGRDAQIADYSVPILNQEVLASQSARVDSVSGATYTSEGYLQSVQSAIDKRG